VKIFGRKISVNQQFLIVFHVVLWTLWVAYPFISGPDDEKFKRYAVAVIPVTLSHIPFFLFNAHWLIPKFYKKSGIGPYLISLTILTICATVLQTAFKEFVVPEELMRRHWNFSWMLLGTLFSMGVSTAYGFFFHLQEREKAMKEVQEEQLKSELSFLRSQISPHFIFNVLNSLVYLIRNKPNLAETVTIRLSELMRYMLYESSDTQVLLKKELDYLKNYVELQKIRFEEDVEIILKIDAPYGDYQIEPMLIIPFVENAFKHGIGMIEAPVIDINLSMHNAQLKLVVKNKIIAGQQEEKDPSSGIGLKNVKRRLELLYPQNHTLQLDKKDDWFITTLDLNLTSIS
jgi:hypothetical protein